MTHQQRSQIMGRIEERIDCGMRLEVVQEAILSMQRLTPGERLELAEWAWAWHATMTRDTEATAAIIPFPGLRPAGLRHQRVT